MMKLKHLFENYDLAKECLAQYDHDEASAEEMLQRFRISSNAVYPFRSGTNPSEVCFLRLSPVEEKPLSSVLCEIRLLQWLREAGCPVMEPVLMNNGKLADTLCTRWGDYNVSCFKRVPGRPLDGIGGTPALVRGYGRSLGALHAVLSRYPAAHERRDHTALLCEIRGRLLRYGAPAFMLHELDFVEEALCRQPIREDNYGIVHYDYEPDNVFYDEKTDTFSAIDFDDMMRCWFSLDVACALDSLDDMADFANDAEAAQAQEAFILGYREAFPLSDEDARAMPLMRRLLRLRQYSTLLYALSEPTEQEPQWLVQLKEKLTKRIASLEAAVEGRGE